MADIDEPTEEMKQQYAEWVAEQPDGVRQIADRFFPWKLYRMKSTGHRVTVYSFDACADGQVTLTVSVRGRFNLVQFERQVFGIDPDDLEECDLPGPDEPVGAVMTVEEATADLDKIRRQLGPGFWQRTPAGDFVRRKPQEGPGKP